MLGKCFVVSYVCSFPAGVYVGTLNLIASVPDPSILTSLRSHHVLAVPNTSSVGNWFLPLPPRLINLVLASNSVRVSHFKIKMNREVLLQFALLQ